MMHGKKNIKIFSLFHYLYIRYMAVGRETKQGPNDD